MTQWPNTRIALARLFAALSVCALPAEERHLIGVGFDFLDLLKMRAHTIRVKGARWKAKA